MRASQRERARPFIDAALENLRDAVKNGDRSYVPPYEEAAALQLMLGNREVALELFDKAIDAGALEGEFPKVDPLMAGIRHEPRFVESLRASAERHNCETESSFCSRRRPDDARQPLLIFRNGATQPGPELRRR